MEQSKIDSMKCGMFNNISYWGKKSSVLKSGVCKYFRRGEIDKYEWCVIEMMIFGLKNKGLMSNIINRLKILIMEEIVISDCVLVGMLIDKIIQIEKVDVWDEKVKLVLDFVKISKMCKRGRICSYVNNWWRFKGNNYDLDKIEMVKVNKYKKKGDSLELLKYGELLIDFIENKDERMMDIFHKMYNLDGKYGKRYRRNEGVYLFWEIIEDYYKSNEVWFKIFNFAKDMFYKKGMIERPSFAIWIGLCVLNYDKFDWDKSILYEENKIVLNEYFKERKDLDMDEYVVKDYHVNKKYGLDKFAIEGAFVKDEYLDDLKEGKLYKEFYIEKKIEKSQIDKNKKNKTDPKTKPNKSKKKGDVKVDEYIDWNDFEVIKVLEEGVCGLKKCCILVKYNDNRYILKEFEKGLNWGIDYQFIDSVKYLFDIESLGIKRIRSNIGLDRVDKSIKSFVGNWVLKEKESIYCMMDYKENIGDLGKNKDILVDGEKIRDLMMIRLFDGLFRSSDNILRNILVTKDKHLISIDEGDIFGKRANIFDKKGDWCIKNVKKEIVDDCLNEIIEKNKEEKRKIIKGKMIMMGFESKIDEFNDRFNNYKNIVYDEMKL
jgi:hypothetical protein